VGTEGAATCPSASGGTPAAGEGAAKTSEAPSKNWEGVDDTVVGRYAKEAGRAPRKAFIDTDRGDLLLFVFLLAGIAGGFVMGYNYRVLFGKKAQGQENAPGGCCTGGRDARPTRGRDGRDTVDGRDMREGQENAPGA
jgi:hypothetical protein